MTVSMQFDECESDALCAVSRAHASVCRIGLRHGTGELESFPMRVGSIGC
jgi:hypothetical protein